MKPKEKAITQLAKLTIKSNDLILFKNVEDAIDIALKEQAKEIFKEIEQLNCNLSFVFNKEDWEELKQKYSVK